MELVTISDARKNLYQLVNEIAKHEPVLIKGKKASAVLISNEDWEDLQETLFVMQNKALYKSIVKGRKEPYEGCKTKLDW